MVITKGSSSAKIRSRVNHPIIDADGHVIETMPILEDYMKQIGGTRVLESNVADAQEGQMWHRMSPEERVATWTRRPTWWFLTADTLDRATASLPRLLYEHLDELGMDFVVLYPSLGMRLGRSPIEELRRVGCRAYNTYQADMYRDYADRMTPVAMIPMHTPQEAIEELEYAVSVLGLKAVTFQLVNRPIPSVHREHPDLDRVAHRLDTFGLDSEYDYDPVWAKCLELKVAPTSHSNGIGWGSRESISSYMYNHVGHCAAAGHAMCKSLFVSGVTKRFPKLKFAFLEGGVGWACILYADLIGHWEKRNGKAIRRLDPSNLEKERLLELFAQYGGPMVASHLEKVRESFDRENPAPPAVLDEYAPCGIEQAEEIRDMFVPNFYFGCEADDPMNATAFNTKVNPFGARLRALFGSDIGHWDVPDMKEVVAEAYELVERTQITEEDFRDFMFTNPVSLYAGMNQDFFKGTQVEGAVAELLEEGV